MSAPTPGGARPSRADLLWSLALFLFAVAVRIPNLLLIPEITDETEEVREAIRIVREGRWPLVAVDAYDGPLFIYLLSFVLRVGGFCLATPRGFSLVVGALSEYRGFVS